MPLPKNKGLHSSLRVSLFVLCNFIRLGVFPTGINAAMLSGEHLSVQRNPLMAGAFHRTGAVEIWGRGTNRVIDACKAYGVAPPEYSELGEGVVVTFKVATSEARPVPQTVENHNKTTGKTTGKTPDAVLVLLTKTPRLTVSELAIRLGKTELTIHRAIRKLRETGRLQRIGPDKGGYWQVLDGNDKEPR